LAMTITERRRELERIFGNTLDGEKQFAAIYLGALGVAAAPGVSWLEQIEQILAKEFPADPSESPPLS
jgi:hypothetical protein